MLAREVQLLRRPAGALRADDFQIAQRQLPELRDGQFLVRNRYLSIDPVRRMFFANGTAPIGAGLHAYAIGEIIASRHDAYAVGEIVGHYAGLRDLGNSDGADVRRIDAQDEPLALHMGPLGVGGFTAYVGLLEIARARAGETVFVSAAAGSVGSVAAQIARAIGCKVIGSSGSAEKCRWLRDVARLDHVINYKERDLPAALLAAAPAGLDIYFDNVGGSQLDAALSQLRPYGRVAVSGMVSAYDGQAPFAQAGGAWTWKMMTSSVSISSYNFRDYTRLWPQFLSSTRQWLDNGVMRVETELRHGLEAVPQAFVDLLAGANLGKMLVELG